uniref:Uncharacterized protein n=1 Tax=Lygus hesperus TaxID=30085 RepID=A0A146LVA7_LYGHE
MNGQAGHNFRSLYSLLRDGTTTPLDDLKGVFSKHQQVIVSRVTTEGGPVSVFKVDYGNSSKSFDAPTMDYRGVFMGFDERKKKWFYVRDSFPVSQTIVLHETEKKEQSLLQNDQQWADTRASADQEYEIEFSDLAKTYEPDDEWKVYRKYDGMMTTASVFFKSGTAYEAFIAGNLGEYFPDHVIDRVHGLVIVFCSRKATKLGHQFDRMKPDIKSYVKKNVLNERFPKTDFTLVMEACGNELIAKSPRMGREDFYVLATLTHESEGVVYKLRPLEETLCLILKTKELESKLRSMYLEFLAGVDGGADTGEGYVIYPPNQSQPSVKVKYSSFIICHVVKRLTSKLIDRFPIVKERYNTSEGQGRRQNNRGVPPRSTVQPRLQAVQLRNQQRFSSSPSNMRGFGANYRF